MGISTRKHQIGELCASTRCFDDLLDERFPVLPRHLAISVDVPRHPLPQCSALRSFQHISKQGLGTWLLVTWKKKLRKSTCFLHESHQIPPFLQWASVTLQLLYTFQNTQGVGLQLQLPTSFFAKQLCSFSGMLAGPPLDSFHCVVFG